MGGLATQWKSPCGSYGQECDTCTPVVHNAPRREKESASNVSTLVDHDQRLTLIPSEKVETERRVTSCGVSSMLACPRLLLGPVYSSAMLRLRESDLTWRCVTANVALQCVHETVMRLLFRFALPHALQRKPKKVCSASSSEARLSLRKRVMLTGLLSLEAALGLSEAKVSRTCPASLRCNSSNLSDD